MLHKLTTAALILLLSSGVFYAAAPPNGGHILGGSIHSPVRIEVFSDFQCPACRDLYLGAIKQVLQDYSSKDKVCVIYHEFPLQQHPYSREASKYCVAAARLSLRSLRTAYDLFFSSQTEWAGGNLEAVLSRAFPPQDLQKLKSMVRDPEIEKAIEKEIQLAMKMEIRSTPTMFIYHGGKEQKVETAVSYAVLRQYLNSIIK